MWLLSHVLEEEASRRLVQVLHALDELAAPPAPPVDLRTESEELGRAERPIHALLSDIMHRLHAAESEVQALAGDVDRWCTQLDAMIDQDRLRLDRIEAGVVSSEDIAAACRRLRERRLADREPADLERQAADDEATCRAIVQRALAGGAAL